MSVRSSSTIPNHAKLTIMRSFKYFEKIPIWGKCWSLILFPLKMSQSHAWCLMSNVQSPMSSWSWRSWQFLVYWSLTLKQLHLVILIPVLKMFFISTIFHLVFYDKVYLDISDNKSWSNPCRILLWFPGLMTFISTTKKHIIHWLKYFVNRTQIFF